MKIAVHLLLLGLGLAPCSFHRTLAAERPNIILIMADDMGFSDLGCYGSEIATPHLDRLAAAGLRFTHFYNAARCCPTRASLLTGLYPHQAGVGGMINDLGTPAYQGYLNDRCVTIAEVLRAHGYTTLMAGKWHVGENQPHWPADRGFDRYFGLISGACNFFKLDSGRKMALDGQPYIPPEEGFYMTDAFVNHAVQFLSETKGKPFFLYLPFTAPHWPLHALPEDIAKYRGKYRGGWDKLRAERHERMIKMGLVDAKWPLAPRDPSSDAWSSTPDHEEMDLRMAVYAAQIDRMDQGIGKVLAKVRELGAEQNTLVMFLADNGGCHEGVERSENKTAATGTRESFRSYGLPWANASNTPFRRFKHWVHEGGITTPLIVYWPAAIKQTGTLTHQAGHVIDLLPTCLDAAGANYPATFQGRGTTPVEGRSLLPIFQGQTRAGHEALYWEHMDNRAVLHGSWKLVSAKLGPWELYDLAADRTELTDLSSQHPDKVKQLSSLYEQWAAKVGALPQRELKALRR